MSKPSITIIAVVVLVFTLASVTMAADPIIGTWKLNITQSKFSPVLQALQKKYTRKERTENYRVDEKDRIVLSTNTILTDGSSLVGGAIWPAQGGMVIVHDPPVADTSQVETLIEPGNWYVTIVKNGKQDMVIHKTISKDGKVLRQTFTGTDPAGKPYEHMEVYDRQ